MLQILTNGSIATQEQKHVFKGVRKMTEQNKKNAPYSESHINENIISQAEKLCEDDFSKSGINKQVIDKYLKAGYLTYDNKSWKLYYKPIPPNNENKFYTTKIYGRKKNKYYKPKGMETQLFVPLELDISYLLNPKNPIILTEGEKKSIKAVLEGFPCIALSGVFCWKKKVQNNDKTDNNSENESIDDEDEEHSSSLDIISDLLNLDLKGREIYLCFDNDMWEKPQVKRALYLLAAYLIGERKARVKIIYLPKSDEKLGLDDFLVKYGKSEFQKLYDNAEEITLNRIQEELTGNSASENIFPLEIFNEDVRNFIIDCQKRLDAPIEYIATLIIAGASILMNGTHEIVASAKSDWIEYPILWVAIVGEPSKRKTPCFRLVKNIIDGLESILEHQYYDKMEKYREEMEEYKREKKKKESNMPEPKKPIRERITTQNTTVEALAKVVNLNSMCGNRGVSICVDELSTLLEGCGQYKKNKNVDEAYFLQSWLRQKFNLIRVTNDIDYIIYPAHTIMGTIQPKVLNNTILMNGLDVSNGMIERWLYVTSKYEETGLQTNSSEHFDKEILRNIYTRLFHQTEIRKCKFDYKAQACFDDFCYQIVQRKKERNMPELAKSYLQKQTTYVARISLILHCMENPYNNDVPEYIVKRAIKLSNYFVKSFERIAIKKASSIDIVEEILNKLLIKKTKSISPSELYKNNLSKLRNTDHAKIILEHLQNRAYGRLKGAAHGLTFVFY